MTSAMAAARADPFDCERVTAPPTAETRYTETASGGTDQPPTFGTGDPRGELDAPADGEGAK